MSILNELLSYLDSCTAPADLVKLKTLLTRAEISREDVATYCNFSADTYKRNLVKSSDWYELLVMCWRSGQRSVIHDHTGASCALKIIAGIATEVRCAKTREGFVRPTAVNKLQPGDVCASASADIHWVSNDDPTQDLITLHIYSPTLKMNTYEIDPEFEAEAKSARLQ